MGKSKTEGPKGMVRPSTAKRQAAPPDESESRPARLSVRVTLRTRKAITRAARHPDPERSVKRFVLDALVAAGVDVDPADLADDRDD